MHSQKVPELCGFASFELNQGVIYMARNRIGQIYIFRTTVDLGKGRFICCYGRRLKKGKINPDGPDEHYWGMPSFRDKYERYPHKIEILKWFKDIDRGIAAAKYLKRCIEAHVEADPATVHISKSGWSSIQLKVYKTGEASHVHTESPKHHIRWGERHTVKTLRVMSEKKIGPTNPNAKRVTVQIGESVYVFEMLKDCTEWLTRVGLNPRRYRALRDIKTLCKGVKVLSVEGKY